MSSTVLRRSAATVLLVLLTAGIGVGALASVTDETAFGASLIVAPVLFLVLPCLGDHPFPARRSGVAHPTKDH